jgi:hypothetical protein
MAGVVVLVCPGPVDRLDLQDEAEELAGFAVGFEGGFVALAWSWVLGAQAECLAGSGMGECRLVGHRLEVVFLVGHRLVGVCLADHRLVGVCLADRSGDGCRVGRLAADSRVGLA